MTAKLLQNGQSQVVHLTGEIRFDGDTVGIKRFDNAVVLLPRSSDGQTLFDNLDLLPDAFLDG